MSRWRILQAAATAAFLAVLALDARAWVLMNRSGFEGLWVLLNLLGTGFVAGILLSVLGESRRGG